MYKMLTLETEPAFRQIMEDDVYKEVINFFITQSSDVTLRDLKKALPHISEIEKKMELWVHLELISRHHGRYELTGETLSKVEQDRRREIYKDYFPPFLEKLKEGTASLNLSKKDQSFYMVHALFTILGKEISPLVYLEETTELKELESLPVYLQKLPGIKTVCISYESFDSLGKGISLATYFYEQRYRTHTNTENYSILNNKIGDVNTIYFIGYIERKLRRLEKGRSISVTSSDVFLEALAALNYLRVENDEYKINTTLIDKDILATIVGLMMSIIEALKEELSTIWGIYEQLLFLDVLKKQGLIEDSRLLVGYEHVIEA